MYLHQCKIWMVVLFVLVLTTACIHAAPIHDAVKSGNVGEITRLLIQERAQVNLQDKWGFTPLMYAVREKRLDVVNLLLKNGARVSLKDRLMKEDSLDKTRLYLRRCGDEYLKKQIELWNRQKASEQQITERITAHKEACGEEDRKKWIEIESVLMEALKKEKAADQESPLLRAVVQGNVEETKRLLDDGCNTEVKDSHGRTPLLLAVMHGNMAIVELLLDHGAQMAEPDVNGQTAYSIARRMFELFVTARRERDYRHFQEMVAKGELDIDAKDKSGETPLMRAVAEGRFEDVKHLLQLGATTEIRNNKGESLKDIACTRIHSRGLKEQILKHIAEASEMEQKGGRTER